MTRTSDGVLPLIAIERGGARPLHEQICAGFRAAIVRGDLTRGQRVPSSRELATNLGVSRMPVLTAYAQLTAEGYFEGRAGAGSFVARGVGAVAAGGKGGERRGHAKRGGSRAVARRVDLTPAYRPQAHHGRWGAFGVHQPALELFPFRVWSSLIHRHSRNPSTRALRHLHPLGLERCREAVCAYLRTARAVRCEPSQVMMVSGSQQALDLCVRVLCDPGAAVWMEEPGYWLARRALLGAGCRVVPVPVDEDGMKVADGVRRSPRARAALVSPSHQYPMGATMSAGRRMQLLDWAEGAGAWVLEDDYDGEYRYEAQPVVSLQGLDQNARVIYIGTLSKVMFPSLRLGYIVLPPDLVEAFVTVRFAQDIGPGYLTQEALADFMAEGHFARHIQRTRRAYRERRNALVDALAEELPGWTVHGAASGMHLTVTAPKAEECDDVAAASRAAAAGISLWPLSPAYAGRVKRTGFILGFGSTTAAGMSATVRTMRKAVEG